MIPIVDVVSPPNAFLNLDDIHSHDFSIYILKDKIKIDNKVIPLSKNFHIFFSVYF